MTTRTRRRLTVLFVLALFTLPVQALVGPALRTPDMGAAAREWVADLSPTALHGAATDIRAYPFEFRRAIMAALTPDDRVSVWMGNFQMYVDEHPELNAAQRLLIDHAMSLMTPEVLSGPPASPFLGEQIGATYDVAVSVLGKRVAYDLFYRLGPDRPQGDSPLPLGMRVANVIRHYTVAYAADAPGCDCSSQSTVDCNPFADRAFACAEANDCTINADFPMCGPFWSFACGGTCRWTGRTAGH